MTNEESFKDIKTTFVDNTLFISKNKSYIIDFSKVKTFHDVIEVLKAMNLVVHWFGDCPEQFKYLHDNGFLKENK